MNIIIPYGVDKPNLRGQIYIWAPTMVATNLKPLQTGSTNTINFSTSYMASQKLIKAYQLDRNGSTWIIE